MKFYLIFKQQLSVNKNGKDLRVTDSSLKTHKPIYWQEVPADDKKILYVNPTEQNRDIYYRYKIWVKKRHQQVPFCTNPIIICTQLHYLS